MADAPENSIQPLDRAAWRRWLADNHSRAVGIWVVTLKKTTAGPRLSYDELVEEALCHGWVDSKPNALDETRSMLWCAPRKAATGWSRLNKRRVEELIASGLMAPPGLAKVEQARKDGFWSRLDAVEALEIPDDLAKAFDRYAVSARNFEAFPRSVKRNILEWIGNAKRADTRSTRVEETARLAGDNIRANQWRK